MTFAQFWYCVRLELGISERSPDYRRSLREAARVFSPSSFKRHHGLPVGHECTFIIITENHVKHLRPVADQMRAENRPFVVLFANATLFRKFSHEWPDRSFDLQEAVTWSLYLRAVLFELALLVASIKDRPSRKSAIIRFSKPVYLFHSVMLEWLRRHTHKVVLFKAEGHIANSILVACRATGTTSFAIQHGLIGDTDQVSNLSVDHYLVWADIFRERLERWRAGCNVTVVGNAAYDSVFRQVGESDVTAPPVAPCHVLLLPNAGLSHTPLDQVHHLLDIAIEYASQNPTMVFTVKPHPGDVQGNVARHLSRHLARLPNIRLLGREDAIPFEQAHLVAINNSASGMEACIWQKPLLVCAPSWQDVMVKQYVEHGVGEFVDTGESFGDKASRILNNYGDYQGRCRAFTREQLAYQGHAAERIVEALTC